MSESREDDGGDGAQRRPQGGSGQGGSGQSGSGAGRKSESGQKGGSGQKSGGGGRSGGKPYDPVADLQGWLLKQGARSMANQVADNVRRTLGQQRKDSGDVWDTATTEPPPGESPECQWCPVCQAARRLRESGPGLGTKIADVGGVFASVVADAFSAMEQVMKVPEPKPRQDSRPGDDKENRA